MSSADHVTAVNTAAVPLRPIMPKLGTNASMTNKIKPATNITITSLPARPAKICPPKNSAKASSPMPPVNTNSPVDMAMARAAMPIPSKRVATTG